jgi:hypothetical protein
MRQVVNECVRVFQILPDFIIQGLHKADIEILWQVIVPVDSVQDDQLLLVDGVR